MPQARRTKSVTKAAASLAASTAVYLVSLQFAISRPFETAKSYQSTPLNAAGAEVSEKVEGAGDSGEGKDISALHLFAVTFRRLELGV